MLQRLYRDTPTTIYQVFLVNFCFEPLGLQQVITISCPPSRKDHIYYNVIHNFQSGSTNNRMKHHNVIRTEGQTIFLKCMIITCYDYKNSLITFRIRRTRETFCFISHCFISLQYINPTVSTYISTSSQSPISREEPS